MGLLVMGKLGNKGCTKCQRTPSHALNACGHTTCYEHYVAAEGATICGYCDKVRLPHLSLFTHHNSLQSTFTCSCMCMTLTTRLFPAALAFSLPLTRALLNIYSPSHHIEHLD